MTVVAVTQLSLFDGLIRRHLPSPLCVYQGACARKGRAVLGEPEDTGGSVQRSIRCVTCGRTGVQSTNTERRKERSA